MQSKDKTPYVLHRWCIVWVLTDRSKSIPSAQVRSDLDIYSHGGTVDGLPFFISAGGSQALPPIGIAYATSTFN